MSKHAAATGSGGVLHRFQFRNLLLHLLIGLAIVVAVLFIEHRSFLKTDRDDAAADDLMKALAGVVQEDTRPYPFALIAIDEQTYRDWKEPLITPRDKLAEIIKFAKRGEAKLIFLDIELSRLGDGTPVSEWLKSSSTQRMRNPDEPARCGQLRPLEKADAELCDRMVGQPGKCDQLRQLRNADARLCEVVTQADSVPIILARTIVPRADSRPGEERWEARPSFLDPILGDVSNPNVHWASPLYSLDSDRFIRRWRMWELVCENSDLKDKSKLKAVPSVELRAFALLDQKADMSKELTDVMARIPKGDCVDRKTNLDLRDPFKLRFSDERDERDERVIEIDLTPESPRDRILYSIDWSGEQSRLYADEPRRERRPQVTIPGTNRKTDLVATISARTITDVTDSVELDPSIVKDHVVVIGATHREAGDLHETPLGLMPGSMIIINAIHSLQQYGQVSESTFWMNFFLAVVMMIVCVLAYHFLWDKLCELVFPQIFLLAAFINILFVHEVIWINVALPAVIYSSAMNFWHLRKELIERAAAKRRNNPKLKWRAWLRAFLNERTFDRNKKRGERWRDQSDVRDTTTH